MSYFTVVKCRICGKIYRIYHNEVRGDSTVCRECEKKSDKTQKNYAKRNDGL